VTTDSRSTLICSTFGGNRVNPCFAWENSIGEFSAMVTPAEVGIGARIVGWFKGVWKRTAMLEARITALEEQLRKQPGDFCPSCGERAMRLKQQSGLLGNQGTQWSQEDWVCEKCNKIYQKRIPLKTR
jgi:hypothetical protein